MAPLQKRAGTRARAAATALAFLFASFGSVAAHFNPAGPGSHSSAVDWWLWQAQESVRAIPLPGPYGARLYAELAVSQYLALQAAAPITPPLDPRSVATFAGYRVLSTAFPSRQATVYDPAVRQQFKGLVAAGNFTAAALAAEQAAGFGAADAVLAARLGDGVNGLAYKVVPASNATGLAPGQYRLTPATPAQPAQATWFAPQLGSALSFSFPAANGHDIYHSLPAVEELVPLTVGTPEYAANVAYVKAVGGAAGLPGTTRTAEQTATAEFWMQGDGTSGPAGQWLTAAAGRLPETATELERAELYARVATSIFDTLTVAYYMKYASGHGRSPFWRPITAIWEGNNAAPPANASAADVAAAAAMTDAAAVYGADAAGLADWADVATPKHGNETTAPPTPTVTPPPTTTPPPTPTPAPTAPPSGGGGRFPNWGLRDGLAFVHDLAGLHDDEKKGGGFRRRRRTLLAAAAAGKHGDANHTATDPAFPLPPGGDGSVAPDTTWYPGWPTPPHPEYPAGHVAVAAAAAWTLDEWFGGETHNFTVWLDAGVVSGSGADAKSGAAGAPLYPVGPGVTFADAFAASGDAAASRVYTGAHFPQTVLDTLALGRAVAAHAWDGFTANVHPPVPGPPPPTLPPPLTTVPATTPVPGSKAAVAAAVHHAKVGVAAAEEEVAGMLDAWKDRVAAKKEEVLSFDVKKHNVTV